MVLRVKHSLDLLRTKISMMHHGSWKPKEAAIHVHGISQMTVCYFSSTKDLCEFVCALSSKTNQTFRIL